MTEIIVRDGNGDLRIELPIDPERAIVIHSPEPGVVHVRHTIVPRPAPSQPNRPLLKAVDP